MKKTHTTPLRAPGSPPPGARDSAPAQRGIVRIDSAAIRRQALREHRQAERALARIRNELKQYHERDVPGFQKWLHQAFGPLLARQREVQQALAEKQALVSEILMLMETRNLSEAEAYRKLLWRRAHPQEADAEDRALEEERQRREAKRAGARGHRRAGHPDDEAFFDDDVDDPWEALLDHIERMTGRRPGGPASDRPHRPRQPDDPTARELYRRIVRLLHPDRNGRMDEARMELWHEAQAAWRKRDVNALHSILSRCDAGAAGLGDHTAISLIRRLTGQLKKAAQKARHEAHQLRRRAAWRYEQRIGDEQFTRQIRYELRMALQHAEAELQAVVASLADVERRASRPARARPARPAAREAQQGELPF